MNNTVHRFKENVHCLIEPAMNLLRNDIVHNHNEIYNFNNEGIIVVIMNKFTYKLIFIVSMKSI